MYDLLMVLIDDADFLTKDEALRTLALLLAQQEASCRGLCLGADAQAYRDFVYSRSDAIEAKLRRIIDIGVC